LRVELERLSEEIGAENISEVRHNVVEGQRKNLVCTKAEYVSKTKSEMSQSQYLIFSNQNFITHRFVVVKGKVAQEVCLLDFAVSCVPKFG
jgi:hypothetical protein